jgi:transaldolase
MPPNPLLQLKTFGQTVWLDFLSQRLLTSGTLARLIKEDGLAGLTSNPAIFKEAMADTPDYDDTIRAFVVRATPGASATRAHKRVEDIYQALVVEDIQRVADLFRALYDHSEAGDGFVSLELSPHLAHDPQGTIEEARRLWQAVNRPNLFIKVPATRAGLPAIRQLISEGINLNVTLLFSLPRYWEVAEAYIAGLRDRLAAGQPVAHVASVASFFLSRIDTLLDAHLENLIARGGPQALLAESLLGQVALASAKVAYQLYQEIFEEEQFRLLERQGARKQRLLWASTGAKNPAYSDLKYVEDLIGPETINTMPLKTLEAYRDHGRPALRLEEDLPEAYQTLTNLAELQLNLDDLTQQLETEGLQKFIESYDELLAALAKKFERFRLAQEISLPR